MATETTLDVVRSLSAKVLKIDIAQVTADTSLRTDLEADSLDLAEIAVQLEEHFGIDLREEKFRDARNVGDIAGIVDAEVRARVS